MKTRGLPIALEIDAPEPREYSGNRRKPPASDEGKHQKAHREPEGEGYFDAYQAEGHERAVSEGTTGGTAHDDVPYPGTLLSDIATSWARPFSGLWPEQYLAEEAGSREVLETYVQNRDAERAYSEADRNTPADKRYTFTDADNDE